MTQAINLLMVEDSDDDVQLILRHLKGVGFDVTHQCVQSELEFAKALKTSDWGAVISDYRMPQFDGLTALRVFKRHGRDLPFLLVSGTITEAEVVDAMREGAHDYILKNTLSRLGPALKRELVEANLRLTARRIDADNHLAMAALYKKHDIMTEILQGIDNAAVFNLVPTDGGMELSYMSPGIEALTGYRSDEFVSDGPLWLSCVHPDDVSRVANYNDVAKDKGWKSEYRFKRKDGAWIHLFAKMKVVRFSGVAIDTIVGFVFDQTERIEAENDRAGARELLARSYKMSALGEMAGVIAHEVNNPLTIIIGKSRQLAGLVKDDVLDRGQIAQFAEVIGETALRTVKIINGLRMLSRHSDGDPHQTVMLAGIVEDTVAICSARFKFQQVALTIDAFSKDLTIECRPTEISQVLVNLLNNAFDAVEQLPKPWVRLEVKDAGNCFELKVTDCGSGIPADIRARLLEPFFTTKGVGKGTGLGLSISKKIVNLHGGEFFLDESAENTCFVVRLPKKQSVACMEGSGPPIKQL